MTRGASCRHTRAGTGPSRSSHPGAAWEHGSWTGLRLEGELAGKPRGPGSTTVSEPRSRPSAESRRELQGMTSRLIAQDRYAFVLLKEAAEQISEEDARSAWQALNSQMALIPAGTVPLIHSDGSFASVDLAGFYLDRCSVTNRQYQRFVQAGGYDDLEIWPQEVWPSVARFTDRTGRPGPRDWENGKHPAAQAEHPVVGVCWYEAVAYARWVGKRLAHRRRVAEGRRLARSAQRRHLQPLSLGKHVRAGADEPVGGRSGPDRPGARLSQPGPRPTGSTR